MSSTDWRWKRSRRTDRWCGCSFASPIRHPTIESGNADSKSTFQVGCSIMYCYSIIEVNVQCFRRKASGICCLAQLYKHFVLRKTVRWCESTSSSCLEKPTCLFSLSGGCWFSWTALQHSSFLESTYSRCSTSKWRRKCGSLIRVGARGICKQLRVISLKHVRYNQWNLRAAMELTRASYITGVNMKHFVDNL